MTRNAWPAAMMVTSAMCCVTILAVFHAASADLLTLISAAVVPTVTMLLVGGQISGQVSEVKSQVNGRMTQLIESRDRALDAAQAAGLPVVPLPPLDPPTTPGGAP